MKDSYFMQHLKQQGVEIYEPAIDLVRTLREQEVKTAVVSSSVNCAAILEAAGISHLFDTRVDGVDIIRLALNGKPAPDAFLEAATRLKVEPSRAVVVEDAIAGVEAGHAGRFGSVIGVDRSGHSQALREAGADVVVTNLAEITIAIEPPFAWSLLYEGFDAAWEGVREALCTLGNGYFADAGGPGRSDCGWRALSGNLPRLRLQPAAHRHRRPSGGERGSRQSPNWLPLNFRIGGDEWFHVKTVKLLSYRQELDLRRGMLFRSITFRRQPGQAHHAQGAPPGFDG